MPDNNPNWIPDESFWEEAWADMATRLDEEERSPRLLVFPWRWMGGLMIVALLLASWWFFSSPTVLDNAFPLPQTRSSKSVIAEEIGNSIYSMPSLTAVAEITEQIIPHSPSDNLAEPIRVEENSTRGNSHVAPSQALPIEQDRKIVRSKAIPETAKMVVDLSTQEIITSDNRYPPKKSDHLEGLVAPIAGKAFSISSENPNVATIRLKPQANPLGISAPDSQTNQSSISFFAQAGASHGRFSPGFGYYTGGGVQKKLGKKNQLSASLDFIARRSRIRFSDVPVAIDEAAFGGGTEMNPNVDSTGQVVTSLNSINAPLAEAGRDFVTTYDIRLSLGYEHRLSQRFSIGGDLGVNYLLQGSGPNLLSDLDGALINSIGNGGVIFDRQYLLDFNFNLREERAVVAFADQGGAEVEITEVNRLRFDAGAFGAYRIGHRWQLRFAIRKQLTPLFATNALEEDLWRGELGIRMRIGK